MTNHRSVEVALELGNKGYRGVGVVDGVMRFDREKNFRGNAAVPAGQELLAKPDAVPVLMTADGTLWKTAELSDNLVSNLRAIAELVGLPHDASLDAVYKAVAERLDTSRDEAAA